jgi:2-oxoglutarate ferredoxin oxidoreductase subunit delta
MSKKEAKGLIRVDPVRCKGCGLCVAACPTDAVRLADEADPRGIRIAVANDGGRCTACGACYVICPDTAITVCRLNP